MVAIVSLAASIGPPGSANEIARPATNGARTTRVHSSSGKSLFVVTGALFLADAVVDSLHPSGLHCHPEAEAEVGVRPRQRPAQPGSPGVRVSSGSASTRSRTRSTSSGEMWAMVDLVRAVSAASTAMSEGSRSSAHRAAADLEECPPSPAYLHIRAR